MGTIFIGVCEQKRATIGWVEPENVPWINQVFFAPTTFLEILVLILSTSSPKTQKNLSPCKRKNSKMGVLPCSPPRDSWHKNSPMERESSSTSLPRHEERTS